MFKEGGLADEPHAKEVAVGCALRLRNALDVDGKLGFSCDQGQASETELVWASAFTKDRLVVDVTLNRDW